MSRGGAVMVNTPSVSTSVIRLLISPNVPITPPITRGVVAITVSHHRIRAGFSGIVMRTPSVSGTVSISSVSGIVGFRSRVLLGSGSSRCSVGSGGLSTSVLPVVLYFGGSSGSVAGRSMPHRVLGSASKMGSAISGVSVGVTRVSVLVSGDPSISISHGLI